MQRTEYSGMNPDYIDAKFVKIGLELAEIFVKISGKTRKTTHHYTRIRVWRKIKAVDPHIS